MHIYVITNKKNGRQYVGQTTQEDPWVRINNHFKSPKSSLVAKSISKKGKESFEVEIITLNPNESKIALNQLEIWIITHLNTEVPNGYNRDKGGVGGRKGPFSKETREKMSISIKKTLVDPQIRSKMIHYQIVSWTDPVIRERRLKGIKKSLSKPDVKLRKSQKQKQNWDNPEYKEKQGQRIKKSLSKPETKEKQKEGIKKAMADPAVKTKQKEGMKEYWRKRKEGESNE